MISKETKLMQKVQPEFPISVYPEKDILPKLHENFEDESISLKTELEIHAMYDMGVEGGLTCEIRTKGLDTQAAKTVFLCSITHFRIKRGEPFYHDLEKYQLKRIRKLARQNRNRRF